MHCSFHHVHIATSFDELKIAFIKRRKIPEYILLQDRKYTFDIASPPATYFLMKAAGIEKGAGKPGMWCIFPVYLNV